MSELFGLTCNKTVNISFSFARLAEKNLSQSGWGVGFYRTTVNHSPPYATIIKEPISARDSIFNYFLKYGYIHSNIFLSHFRRASIGADVPLNTHPFQLMLDPRSDAAAEKSWIFAHSGTVENIRDHEAFRSEIRGHGDTDSEYIFCYFMGELRKKYLANGSRLNVEERAWILKNCADKISQVFPKSLNFMLSDGLRLYAYYGGYDSNGGLWYLKKSPPHQKIALFDRKDGMTIQLLNTIPDETVSLVASNPLNPEREEWIPFEIHELKVFEQGHMLAL